MLKSFVKAFIKITSISVKSAYILSFKLSLFIVLLLLGIVLRTITFFLIYKVSAVLLLVQSYIIAVIRALVAPKLIIRYVLTIVLTVYKEGFGALVLLLLIRRNRRLEFVNKLA